MKLNGANVFLLLLIIVSWEGTESAHNRKNETLEIIQKTVLEIYEHLKKEDKFQDIKDILKIDSTLRKIEEQNEELLKRLGNNEFLGRSGVSDSGVEQLENKLETMEEQLMANVRGSINKMTEVGKQTGDFKNEMDKKMQKIMNIITSVYDKFETNMKEKGKKNEETDYAETKMTNFLVELFEGTEKKIIEKFSVMERQLKTDVKEIGSSLSSVSETCYTMSSDVVTLKEMCDNTSTGSALSENNLVKMTEDIVQNLTRKQREITEKMEKQILDLEAKILHSFPHSRQPKEEQNVKAEGKHKNASEPLTELKNKTCNPVSTVKNPRSCWQLYNSGAKCNGTYIIYPQNRKAIFAYCDMESFEGGWTVLMRRGDFGEKLDFNRNWNDYKAGFGDFAKEFWLGNENIHYLTKQEEMVLQIVLRSYDKEELVLEYEPFSVGSESENYKLHIGRVKGKLSYIGSSIRHHNMRPFSTFDRNNEGPASENCAAKFNGGWWYNRCHYALLTAEYFKENEPRESWQGIQWHAWKGNSILKEVEMRIRPKHLK